MNTNDPDYEHIYSIETYDDDAPMVEIADYDSTVNKSQGTLVSSLKIECSSYVQLTRYNVLIFQQVEQTLLIH